MRVVFNKIYNLSIGKNGSGKSFFIANRDARCSKYKLDNTFNLVIGKKGSGKSSMLAKLALYYSKKGIPVFCTEKGIANTFYIDYKDIGSFWFNYELLGSVVLLIDELSIHSNSREFKNVALNLLAFYKMHRHAHCTIWGFTQTWDDSDKQIRNQANRFYMCRNIGFGISIYRQITNIVDIVKNAEGQGQFTFTYDYVPWLRPGSTLLCFRPRYYKLFDSFCRMDVPDIDFKKLALEQYPVKITYNYLSTLPGRPSWQEIVYNASKKNNNFLQKLCALAHR